MQKQVTLASNCSLDDSGILGSFNLLRSFTCSSMSEVYVVFQKSELFEYLGGRDFLPFNLCHKTIYPTFSVTGLPALPKSSSCRRSEFRVCLRSVNGTLICLVDSLSLIVTDLSVCVSKSTVMQ